MDDKFSSLTRAIIIIGSSALMWLGIYYFITGAMQ